MEICQCPLCAAVSSPVLWVLGSSVCLSFILYFHFSGDSEGKGKKHMFHPPHLVGSPSSTSPNLRVSLITSEVALSNKSIFKNLVVVSLLCTSFTCSVFVVLTHLHPILTLRMFPSIPVSIIYIKTLTVGLEVWKQIFFFSLWLFFLLLLLFFL